LSFWIFPSNFFNCLYHKKYHLIFFYVVVAVAVVVAAAVVVVVIVVVIVVVVVSLFIHKVTYVSIGHVNPEDQNKYYKTMHIIKSANVQHNITQKTTLK
jgi:hypothetical protein